jgi:hypothetical protein
MVDLSHLFSLADFSLIDFIFGENKTKNKKIHKEEHINDEKSFKNNNNKNNNKNNNNKFSEKEKKLLLKLEIEIDNFLYRKKIKSLIQKIKENYKIVCSANIPNLSLNIIGSKNTKQYQLEYEPILKQYIVLLPRKKYRNKKKLKFNFINSKKEIFIEPQYKTENDEGSFINVLDLREIKEKEYKNFEDFQNFLKSLKIKKNKSNIKIDKKEEKEESLINKIKQNLKKEREEINFDKNEFKTNYITDSELVYSNEELKPKKIKKRKASNSSLKNIHPNLSGINSILKERKSQRIKNPRKISFGDVQFSY